MPMARPGTETASAGRSIIAPAESMICRRLICRSLSGGEGERERGGGRERDKGEEREADVSIWISSMQYNYVPLLHH